jgi:hypothetical protein
MLGAIIFDFAHVFMCKILANMTQVSDVAPGPLVFNFCCFPPPLTGFAVSDTCSYKSKFSFVMFELF